MYIFNVDTLEYENLQRIQADYELYGKGCYGTFAEYLDMCDISECGSCIIEKDFARFAARMKVNGYEEYLAPIEA